MTSYLNTINSVNTALKLNDASNYEVVIGYGLTSILAANILGATTIGAITGTSATFSTTLGVTGLATFGAGGLTSTAGTTTLGASTIGAITGTSIGLSSTLGVSGLTTLAGGLTSTAGATTLGATTIGAITGTSATLSSTLGVTGLATFSGGLTSTSGTTTLGAIIGTTASLSGQITSTVSTGTAPLVIASTTNIPNLNASSLNGATFASPGPVGSGTSSTGAFTTLTSGATTHTGAVNMSTNKITNLGTPTANTDAATKGYVDLSIQGLDTKQSVVVATTVAGTLATSFINGSVIDFITLSTGDRILIKDQASGIENGIYTVNVSGSPSRSTDFSTASSAAGTFIFIEKGTVNSDSGWVCTNDIGTDVVGTDALVFTQFSGAGSIIAGTGITKTGNTLSVSASQTQITSVGTLTSLSVSGTSNLTTAVVGSGGLTSTAGSTTLGTSTIGAITGTSATFSTTLGVTGLATFGSGGLTSTAGTNTFGTIAGTTTTASTSNSIGAVTLIGGIGISNATDATSSTNGGTITTAGGIGIAKSLFVGTTANITGNTTTSGVLLKGSTSGTISILPQADAGTYDFNLPTALGASGQVLASGGTGAPMSWITPAANSAPQSYTTTGLNNQSTTVNVSGLLYTIGSFDISMTVDVVATTSLSQIFKLTGILSPSSGWKMTCIAVSGDNTNVFFTITSGGQVQYTSPSYAGFTSLTFTWAQFSTTQGTSYLALTGSGSGVVTIGSSTGTYNYNLPAAAGTSGQFLTSGGGLAAPMTWTSTTGTGNAVLSSGATLGATTIGTITGTSATFSTSTASTSNSTGAVVLSGGLGITNTTDATSSTNGGTVTTAGGVGIAKKLFVGTTADITGNLSTAGVLVKGSTGTVSILPQSAAGTFNFNLPTAAGTSGQFLTSGGGLTAPMTWTTPFTYAQDGYTGNGTLTSGTSGALNLSAGQIGSVHRFNTSNLGLTFATSTWTCTTAGLFTFTLSANGMYTLGTSSIMTFTSEITVNHASGSLLTVYGGSTIVSNSVNATINGNATFFLAVNDTVYYTLYANTITNPTSWSASSNDINIPGIVFMATRLK
jgi:hypothetical protein